MGAPVEVWLRAFVLTVLIEAPLVVYLTRDLPIPLWRRAAIAVFAQFVTHPLVWYVFPFIPGLTGRTALTLSEFWAWLGEALFYAVVMKELRPLRAVGIAGIANGLSFAIGLFVMRL